MRALHVSRGGHLLREIARFLTVGGLATVISVVGFNALVHGTLLGSAPMRHEPIPAYAAVPATRLARTYAGMLLWAFRHREVHDPVQGVLRFFGLGALTMAIPVLCLAISRYLLGLSDVWADNLSANVIGLGLSTAARFWVFRRWVFLEAGGTVAEPGSA